MTPVNDDIDEGAGETLQIATATTSGLALRPSAAFTITIEDDDEAGITLSQTRLTVEEGGSASYTISLNTQPTQATQVAISSQGDNRRDLRVTPQSVEFTAMNWNIPQTVIVEAGDDPDGDDENATIKHRGHGGRYTGTEAELAITIADTDLPSRRVTLTLNIEEIKEHQGQQLIRMTATLDGSARSQNTDIEVRAVGGTATEGTDFAEITGATITIQEGSKSSQRSISITPVNDKIDEGPSETVVFGATVPDLIVEPTTLTIIDDDERAIRVPTGVTLMEEDPQGGHYEVKLATEPTDRVRVRISVEGNAQVSVDPTALVFTRESWNTPQRVTVRSGHDDDGAPDTAKLRHVGSGADYEGVSAPPVRVEIEDNDNRRVTISHRRVELREGGRTSYTAVLDTLPTGTVTVEPMLEAGSDADVALSPAMLRFTTRNWNTPQAVTVSASQDDDSDNDRAGITHAISGADYGNAHASVRTINVKVSDDETPSTAVVVQVTNDTVAESDAGAQITVIAELNGAPRTEDVQIEITFEEHGDAEEGVDFRANSATLTIAAGQTRTTGRMTVAPVNDRIDEGDREGFTLFIFATPDLEIRPSAVQGVWIEDDDEAALVLSRDALTVREEGTASYTVKLNSQPTGAVTVTPGATGADADDLTVSPATLTFTPSSWSTAQRVTVEAGADADGDDDHASIAHTMSGGGYAGVEGNVGITIDDIDLASRTVRIALEPDRVAEGDGTPSVTVTAEVDGAARSTQTNVAVRATGGTAKAGVDFVDIGTVTVSIPAGATRATQSFGFSPIDDDIDEGASETVILSATAQGLTGSTATLTITDDDGRGINVSQGAVTVEEDDPSGGTYTVALVSQPAGTVTVRVAVSGNNEVRASPQTLRFTATDWNAPQTVTVTAEHDDDSQADSAQIRHTASGADYTGVSAVSVAVTVNDDDIRGVTISHTALKVREGGQGSYTVVLDTRPTGTVTVTPTVSGDDDVRVSPSTLRFSASRWNTPLTVTVTGAQDIDQAPDIATIAHTVAGADYGTEAVQANNIEVTITDDDVPSTGITISLSTDRVQESGGPIQITVTGELDASPALNDTTVTLTLGTGTAGDDDFVSIEPVPLTIRTGQTSGSAHVLVTPVADYIDEGTGETLRLRATTTSTLELRPQTTFEITIEDDDDPASNEITLTVSRQTLGESAGETQITVTGELNAAPAQSDIIATLTLEAGSADNDDFEAIEPVRLTIRAGRTSGSARVPVTPVNDRIDEGTGETLRLVAEVSQAPASLVIRQPNVFELTIEDDDEAALVLSRNALTVREGESATYTVRLDSQPTDSVTMTLSATGADAEEVTVRPQGLVFTAQDW